MAKRRKRKGKHHKKHLDEISGEEPESEKETQKEELGFQISSRG